MIYEFDGFRLVPGEELLLQNGERVILNLKSFGVLALLVERHGHLVSKAEIIDAVWDDAFVEEGSLTKAISTVRQALGDTSKERFIQTVPRRGYRFVFPVSVVTDGSGAFRLSELSRSSEGSPELAAQNGSVMTADRALPAAPETLPQTNGSDREAPLVGEIPASVSSVELRVPPMRQRSKYTVFAACLVGVVVAVFIGWYGVVRTSPAGTPRSILVLPVAPINTADRDALYEIGIADSLINRLSSAEGLAVRPLGVVRRYVEAEIDPLSAGSEQKVDYVLASSYQIADGRIKVTGQLYNVASGAVEESFNAQLVVSNILTAQDAIAANFGNQLMARFGVSSKRPAKTLGTSNEEAYRLYSQGMYLVDKRGANARKGLEYLDQAVALDPAFARAWAGIALSVGPASIGPDFDHEQVYRRSMDAVSRAVAIDPKLSDAYAALCENKFFYEYEFAEAEAACTHAIELDPNSPAAHHSYWWFLTSRGRHEEAFAEIRAVIDLEPSSYVSKRNYANGLYLARRYDEAAVEFRRLMDFEPTDEVPYNQLIRALEAQQKDAEAFEWFVKLLLLQKKGSEDIANFTDIYRTSGWRGVLIKRAKVDADRGAAQNYHNACLYARAGEKDKAFEYLEKAYEQRDWRIPRLQIEPQLDPIREDPRYRQLVERIETAFH